MKAENEMTLTFPSRSSNESFARAAVACFAAQLDPNLEELNDIKTAVSEAVTNCIVHAYRDCLGTVTIRCRILPENVLDIVIKDKGVGIPDIGRCDGFPGEVFHPGIRFEYSFQKRYGIVGDDFHDGIRIG